MGSNSHCICTPFLLGRGSGFLMNESDVQDSLVPPIN